MSTTLRYLRGPALIVASAALIACGSSGTPAVTSSSGTTAVDFNSLDPEDAAFVAQLRSQGLIPATPRAEFPDAAFVTDANAVCQIVAVPGESAAVIKTDLANMRKNRAAGYGITQDQATQVMILSAQTYCPDSLAAVKSALS